MEKSATGRWYGYSLRPAARRPRPARTAMSVVSVAPLRSGGGHAMRPAPGRGAPRQRAGRTIAP
jgi:hypothetical protein